MSEELGTMAQERDVDGPNADQREYWNGMAGEQWVEAADRYDAQLAVFGHLIVDDARIGPDNTVLDIGCGTGSMTVEAAKAAVSGSVTGVDISDTMLGGARARAQRLGLGNVVFENADAQIDDLPRDRDHVLSRFGVMFFSDPDAAFANITSSLRPGGRLSFTAWRSPADNEWLTIPALSVAHLLQMQPPPDAGEPGPFSLQDPDRIGDLLEDCGLDEIAIRRVDANIFLGGPGSVEHIVEFCMHRSALKQALGETPQAAGEVRATLTETLGRHHDGTGVRFSSSVWLVSAIRPG